MTPAQLKRLERVLAALKQADLMHLARLKQEQAAAGRRAEMYRDRARMEHQIVTTADMQAQVAWAHAQMRRAAAEDLARDAFSVPVAEAAEKLAQTFGREAALSALSERLAAEHARLEAVREENALLPTRATASRWPDRRARSYGDAGPGDGADNASSGSSSTGVE